MFIVIESVDGGGCQTQAELLAKNLPEKFSPQYIKYPHYDNAIGNTIREYLYDDKKLTPNEQFLLYSMQFVSDTPSIKHASEKGIVVADRFFSTTLCYQILEGVNEDTALRFAQDFGIIKPDLIIFQDVSTQTALKRKMGEKKELNFREKDAQFIEKTRKRYLDLAKRNVWTKWQVIDGERSIEMVHNEILTLVQNIYDSKTH